MALPTITNNAPSAGYISWTAFSIQYGGVGYSVGAGSSNKKFVWWEYNAGTPILQTSDTLPDLAVEDYLLFLNKSGIGLIVDTAQVIDGSLIVSGSILADGIGANQIQSWHVNANAITAGKIAAGTITSNEIAAGAISAEKLSIGAVGDNMVLNGSFEDGTQGFTVVSAGAGAVADVVTGVSSSGANALRLVRGTAANLTVGQTEAAYIPVTSVAGRSWYVGCRAGAGAALASGFHLRVFWLQADKVTPASTASVDVANNVALTTAWSVFEGTVTPPANARYMRIAVINALSGSTMYVDEITAHEVIMAAQIGNGQITTAKLVANAVTATQIAANAVTATKIAANAITADKIEATAIDGKTITGATVRTAASGQRVQLDTAGLRTFDAANVETSKLEADAGGLNLTGSLVSRAGSTGPRASLNSGSLVLDNQDAAGSISLSKDGLSKIGAGVPFDIGHDSAGANSPLRLYASGSNAIEMLSEVTFLGDSDWKKIDDPISPIFGSLGSGFAHDTDPYYGGLWVRIKAGVVYITGRITKSSFAGNSVLFTVNSGFRPAKPVVQYAYTGGANFAVAQPDGVTIIALAGTGGATIGLSWPLE